MDDHVFVCYSREDEDFVVKLAENLKDKGVPIWLDQWDIPSGADWDQTIEKALRECTSLLLVISPSSVESKEVRSEWRSALDENKVVVPILYQHCEIPYRLKTIQYIDFTSRSPDDKESLEKILNALGKTSSISEKTTKPIQFTGSDLKQDLSKWEFYKGLVWKRKISLLSVFLVLAAILIVTYVIDPYVAQGYSRDITIRSSTPLNDYQILLHLSGSDFPIKANPDGKDLRFTWSGMDLNYWIEKWDYPGKDAIIWVKVPNILVNAVTKIKLNYGTGISQGSSNGNKTFIFFEDFNGSAVNQSKWDITGSEKMNISNSLLYLGTGGNDTFGRGAALVSKGDFNDDLAVDMKVLAANDADIYIFARCQNLSGLIMPVDGYKFTMDPGGRDNSPPKIVGGSVEGIYVDLAKDVKYLPSPSEFYWCSATLNGANLGFSVFDLNRSIKASMSISDSSHSKGKTGIGKDPREWEGSYVFIDTFFIRKSAQIEPTISIGPERILGLFHLGNAL